jgi:hypothetical protein
VRLRNSYLTGNLYCITGLSARHAQGTGVAEYQVQGDKTIARYQQEKRK